MNDQERRPTNARVVEALTGLAEMLKNDENANRDPPHLSHYRQIPDEVTKAYELMTQGSQMVHSTATKYTLVGKIDEIEQKKLGADLLKGCELVAASAHAILQDSTGCARAVRRATQRAALSIILAVIQLAESFLNHSALKENVGAQKTGAVWEACDRVLNRMLPQGNRNAIRRELFTWTRETNDTMEEFMEMIDRGPSENNASRDEVGEELDDLFGDDDQFSNDDFPIAKACLGILKCSRGTMKMTLEAFEDLGSRYIETQDEVFLDRIARIHALARVIGEGVTDLGSSLYPPLLPAIEALEAQVQCQATHIIEILDCILSMQGLSHSVNEIANVLRVAIDTRCTEFKDAIDTGNAS